MLDFGAVSLEWGTLLFQIIAFLIMIGLPVGLIIYFVVRSGLKKKVKELERRLERLEELVRKQ
ncbi:hypothetical protein NDK47_17985 [Brevibacillus ruminantium]|uniref:DUF4083 domain-containing protein n=1 Tax=Brevibacillus ruminantium TaxID=2950604 RepID=A0ABY4WFD7_9BACL|nr:hypothetical protein [Brevibacillus ruminantium]USG64039.1 hypothetical protein NDK47_17985 [Brevibacillus ruminantium]